MRWSIELCSNQTILSTKAIAVFSEKTIALLSHVIAQSYSRATMYSILYTEKSDVLGPLEADSVRDSTNFVSFIDDHFNWVDVYVMREDVKST